MLSSILLIQLRRIGDVLMSTSAVRELRKTYPQARITFLTEAPSDQVLRGNPNIDEVMLWPRGKGLHRAIATVGEIRRRKFDLAVDFFSNPSSAMIARFSGAPRRIGFAIRGRSWAYTDPLQPVSLPYSAQHKLGLLAPLGVQMASPAPEVFLGGAERDYAARQLEALGVAPGDLLVAISPVSRREYKVWAAAHFARLADVLIERYGAKLLFCWGPGEEHFVDAVRLEMIHNALPTYPVPSLMELAALLDRANLFVGNDNGPRHLAIAVGTPTVGIFGQPWPESWTPPGASMHPTVEHDPGCKRACTYPRCKLECIRDLPYAAVERTMENQLEELLKDGTPA